MTRMRRWKELALAGVTVVLLLLGLRGLIGGGRTRAPALPTTSASDAPASPDETPSAPLDEGARRESAETTGTPTTSASAAAAPGQAVETLAAGAGVQVLVRMKHDRSPVPGALVTYVDFGALARRRAAELADPDDRDAAAARYGRLFRADEHGIAVVPRSENERFVECSANGAFGRMDLSLGSAEPVVLELLPDPDLRVRVLDRSGVPVAGVRVAMILRRSFRIREGPFATTMAPDGLATLRHVQSPLRKNNTAKAAVELAIPLAEPVERAFDPQQLPREPLVLELPDTGSLELLLEEPDGALHAGLASLLLESRPMTSAMAASSSPRPVSLPIRGGRLIVPHVGLGLVLTARVTSEDFDAISAEMDGPRVVGERATLRLAIGRSHPVVTARLVAESTLEPLRNATIDVQQELKNARGSTAVWSSTRQETDAAGRIRVVIAEPEEEIVRRSLSFVARPEEEAEELSARIELARTLPDGESELGDVFLAPRDVLVAGHVVDDRGGPVAGACVQVRPLDDQLEGLEGLGYSNSGLGGELQAASGADGRFEIPGDFDFTALAVTAWRAGYSSTQQPLDVPRGARDVVIVLRRAGAVAGRVLVDEAIGARWARLVLTPESGDDSSDTTPDIDTGYFELKSIEPGRYSLVALVGAGEEVARVDGLVVAPGETARDPRFDPLDLRGKLRSMRIDARCSDAVPVPHYQVFLLGTEPDSLPMTAGWGSPGRPVRLVIAQPAVDLLVQAPEHRDATLLGVSSDREVLLEVGIPVRIVAGGLPRLDPGLSLEAKVRAKDPAGGRDSTPCTGRADATGVVELHVGAAGTFEVDLLLQSEKDVGIPVEHEGVPIEIQDQKELQEFRIELSEHAIEAAAAELERVLADSAKPGG